MSGKGITQEIRAAFDTCLAGADEDAAVELAVRLLDDGVDAEAVLLDLVAPAQVRVGERWAADEWSVAQEHAATHVSGRTVDALVDAVCGNSASYDGGNPGRLSGGKSGDERSGGVLAACSDGEWHVLAARILSEVLRLRGFRVRFLGGHVPTAQLLSDIHQNGPDVVALSCTLSVNLPLAHRQIEVSRQAGVPVLAGGPGFGPQGVWAYALGADLYAPDARTAAELLEERWPPLLRGGSAVEDSCIEAYAQLLRQRRELLEKAVEDLRSRFPVMRERSGKQHDEDTAFLGQLLDALAAGVYVGDPRVLTGHLAFATAYLSARGVDAASLETVLGTLVEELGDSALILRHVVAGQRWLAGEAGHTDH